VTHETGMRAVLAPDPLNSVVYGSGQALENIEAMRGLLTQTGID
jgi:rod shape-determining protein MreB